MLTSLQSETSRRVYMIYEEKKLGLRKKIDCSIHYVNELCCKGLYGELNQTSLDKIQIQNNNNYFRRKSINN